MNPDVRQSVVEQLGRLLKVYRAIEPQDKELTGFDSFVRIPDELPRFRPVFVAARIYAMSRTV